MLKHSSSISLLLKHSRRPSSSIFKLFMADPFSWNIHGDHFAASFSNFCSRSLLLKYSRWPLCCSISNFIFLPISFAGRLTATIMLEHFKTFCGRSLLQKHSLRLLCSYILNFLWPTSFAETFRATIRLQYFQTFCGRCRLLIHSRRPSCCSIFLFLFYVTDLFCWNI